MKTKTSKILVRFAVYFACLGVAFTLFNIVYGIVYPTHPILINGVLLTITPFKPAFVLFLGYLTGVFGLLMWYKDLLERELTEHQLEKGGTA